MFSSSIFLFAHCHLQPFFTPVSSKVFPLEWPFLKARTRKRARTSGENFRTRQNADKPNTDSDCFGFLLLLLIFFSVEMIVINHGFQFLFYGYPSKRRRIPPLTMSSSFCSNLQSRLFLFRVLYLFVRLSLCQRQRMPKMCAHFFV